jgi:hypothetical protein
MSFCALDRYYVKLFEVNLDFLFFIVKKRLNNTARQHTIPWNKVCTVPSILHTVGVNWNSRSEIDTAYTGKCDIALNNKQVLRKCLKALDKVHAKTF